MPRPSLLARDPVPGLVPSLVPGLVPGLVPSLVLGLVLGTAGCGTGDEPRDAMARPAPTASGLPGTPPAGADPGTPAPGTEVEDVCDRVSADSMSRLLGEEVEVGDVAVGDDVDVLATCSVTSPAYDLLVEWTFEAAPETLDAVARERRGLPENRLTRARLAGGTRAVLVESSGPPAAARLLAVIDGELLEVTAGSLARNIPLPRLERIVRAVGDAYAAPRR